ncbi:MAG TPA: dual specificity protein phosphatase family protein [Thermodesulfobacteriota bacterium]|nr:dual specificity protein phosphatase family protein [Thermodesulfobacteriota bacterium]
MPIQFSWIVTNKLAGMERPGSICSLEEDLQFLKNVGINIIINLEEYVQNYEEFDVKHIPIKDFKAPKLTDIEEFVELVENNIRKGKKIVVHCYAGMGRTNLMLASYLVYLGLNPDEALGIVRARRPSHAVNEEQIEALREYYYVRLDEGDNNTSKLINND